MLLHCVPQRKELEHLSVARSGLINLDLAVGFWIVPWHQI